MEKEFIDTTIKTYLAEQFFCPLSDLDKDSVLFTINKSNKCTYIKIVAYNKCIIVNTSELLNLKVKTALIGKSRDEIFEFPFVYGQTIHFVPDVKRVQKFALSNYFSYELLREDNIQKLRGIKEFDNSLVFDGNGNTSTKIAFLAKKDGQIVGLAGASKETDSLFEVGIDVKPQYRKEGLGTGLVTCLTIELMNQGIIPFYSASVTNIGSQIVANRSGYVPCWVDTYGNTLDGSSAYDSFVEKLVL